MTKLSLLLASSLTLLAAGLFACEEKQPPAPGKTGSAAAPAPKTPDPAKPVADLQKDMADKAKEAKEAVTKPIEEVKKTVTEAPKEAAKEAAKKATEIAQNAKDAMKGYLDKLGKANGLLEKITSPFNAAPALPELGSLASGLNTDSTLLNALPADQKSTLMTDNKSALEPLTTAFKAQVERLSKDGALSKIVGDALKNFKLFE